MIRAQGLRKTFGTVRALDGIDLHVPEGTVLGLLGPNGAGKTTVVRVLTTLLRPDEGTASVAGFDVVRQAGQVRERIGLAGQYAAVDENLTGRENLVLAGRLSHLAVRGIRGRADALLEQFDLVDAGRRPVRTYSGGMRRRLDLAASLIGEPSVVFLDEPTTGLDITSRTALWEKVRGLVRAGTTVLLTTQYLEEADALADRIAVVDRGRMLAEGTPQELKSRLGQSTLEIRLADVAAARAAADQVAGLAVTAPSVAEGGAGAGATLSLAVADGPSALVDVVRRLDDAGLRPLGVSLREPSLDDVFLSLTARPAA